MQPKDANLSYRDQVKADLRTRCVHLRTKESFLALPERNEVRGTTDEPIWWCDLTSEALGPDGSAACHAGCHGAARGCYIPPLRL